VERDSFLNFTPDLRERIRAEFELTAVIRRFQKLEKRNLVYAGRCPFHPDGSSSLRVSKKRQIFKCLGCGAGGDVFSYISRFEEVSLPEAIVSLAAESGTSLTDIPGELARASDYRCRLLELMKSASLFFEDQLAGNPSALEYLQKRGISPETRNKFAFGFAPPGSLLMTEMAKQGYSLKELEAAGLIVRNDAGGYYDKFRNRIILSIRDLQGKIIAFGGRAFGDTLPKYLNSPETILYNKRNQLFGLSDAAQEIISQDLAVLVEGYFDCVVPSQFGIGNIVASLGTSLTEQQVSLLGGFTRNVIVSFDPDSAGREATARSINMFLSQGFSVRVMQLPEGMDPDQLIIEQGAGAYRQLLEKAVPFVDFMVGKHLLSSVRAMSPQGKQEIVTQVIPSLLLVPNQVERSRMAARLASLLKLDEKLILEEMRRFPRQPRPQDPSLDGNPMLEGITLSERLLLGALLDRDRCLPILEGVESRLFEGSGIKPVYDTILKLRKKNEIPSVPRVRDELDDAEKDVLEYWAVTEEALSIDRDNIANSVADLEGRLLKRRIREIQEEISRHESGEGDPVKLRDLLREKERLMRQTLP